jgi:short-chain fatty acids transporter
MLKSMTNTFVRFAERWMPDPMVIAIILTAVTIFAAVGLTEHSFVQTVDAWGTGVWSLMAFTMQMVMMLVLGHVLAHTGHVVGLLDSISARIRSARMAYFVLTLFAALCSFVSWGLAIIAPALLAVNIAKALKTKGIKVHFPLLMGGAWAGSVMWHHGISHSIGLAVNTPGHFLEDKIGMIGTSQTIFSDGNMILMVVCLILIPFLMMSLAPNEEDIEEIADGQGHVKEAMEHDAVDVHDTPASRLENSRLLPLILGVGGSVYVINYFISGGGLGLNVVNFIFLSLGLLLVRSINEYLVLLRNAASVIGPFLIQYPLYAGLMGIMANTGLGSLFVESILGIATATTLPLWSFFSAAILNIFIPSGGGQWVVQGPIVMEAAQQLGADIPKVIMAVSYGDSVTNLIQPLFVIPALAIAGLHVRQVMGYSLMAFLLFTMIFVVTLTFF